MSKVRIISWSALFGVIVLVLAACAKMPDDAQIEAAIRISLEEEAAPPDLKFEDMEVPARYAGGANAVLWTEDQKIQRNYSLAYDRHEKSFVVLSFTTSRRAENGGYYTVPNDLTLTFTEYAEVFAFSSDFSQKYLLLYAGQGGELSEMRATFEREHLSDFDKEQLSAFKECDLGGETLILLVPRYAGSAVWVKEILYRGDRLESGAELARFGADPVYILCDLDDDLPEYEIHISAGEQSEFFLTRESTIAAIIGD